MSGNRRGSTPHAPSFICVPSSFFALVDPVIIITLGTFTLKGKNELNLSSSSESFVFLVLFFCKKFSFSSFKRFEEMSSFGNSFNVVFKRKEGYRNGERG